MAGSAGLSFLSTFSAVWYCFALNRDPKVARTKTGTAIKMMSIMTMKGYSSIRKGDSFYCWYRMRFELRLKI